MNPLPRLAREPAPVPGARWIALTQGRFALVDADDFERIDALAWYYGKAHGYAARTGIPWHYARRFGVALHTRPIYMHGFVLGEPPTPHAEVDHINRDPLDNRKANLRWAIGHQNMGNASLSRRNKSGFKGVFWRAPNQQWSVAVGATWIGRFDDLVEAACAYNAAAVEHFGRFANLNRMD